MARSPARFEPAWWLRNRHAQTLWGSLCRPLPRPRYVRQRLELDDGDFLDLDWSERAHDTCTPLVLVLHGLEGSSRSPYARGLVHRLERAGYAALVLHFRGCSGYLNRLARTYHSGETSDLRRVVDWLAQHWPTRPLYAVGFSLGGNVLLKYLGESGHATPIAAAVAHCVPMRLAVCATRMERGFSRLYLRRLVSMLKRKMRAKYRHRPGPIDLNRIARTYGFRDFDDVATAPLHGFTDADHYYRSASAAQFVSRIRTPTLIVHASDDPFMSDAVLPHDDDVPPDVHLEIAARGGHVGFVAGSGPLGLLPRYWLDQRTVAFFDETSRASLRPPPSC